MYCVLEYIELPQFIDDSVPLLQQILAYQSTEGLEQENKIMLFNPNCPQKILLEYLCDESTVTDILVDFDLCDSSTGDTVNFKQLHFWAYATNVLKPKQAYVFVLFENIVTIDFVEDSLGCYKVLEPLLNKHSKQYADVLLRIKRQKGLIRKSSAPIKKMRRRSLNAKTSASSCDVSSSRR